MQQNQKSSNNSLKDKFCRLISHLKVLTCKRFPQQPEYEQCWQKYERLLMYRSNLTMFSAILHRAYNMYSGNLLTKISEEAVEEGLVPNAQLAKTVYPYANIAFQIWGIMNVIFLIVSCKYIKITKVYFYHHVIFHAIILFLPLPLNSTVSITLKLASVMTMFPFYYFHFWVETIITMFLITVPTLTGRYLFHEEPLDSDAIKQTVLLMLLIGIACWFIHICFVQIGMYYVKAEIMRIGNEQLLNNLEEGVVIQNEETKEIIFINEAAKKIGTAKTNRLSNDGDPSAFSNQSFVEELITGSKQMDFEQKLFAYVDPKILHEGIIVDSIKTAQEINALSDYKTFNEVIETHQKSQFPGMKMYKFKNNEVIRSQQLHDAVEQSNMTRLDKQQFFSIKVKKQIYIGSPAIAIYINDRTKKVREKFARLCQKEKVQEANQTETYTSTVNHEMRTPLATAIFFLGRIIIFLTSKPQHIKKKNTLKETIKYSKLVMSQLHLIQSFVEDLLDLRQIKDGVLSLTANIFDPNKIFEEILETFYPQAEAKKIGLQFQVRREIRLPEHMYPHSDPQQNQQIEGQPAENTLLICTGGDEISAVDLSDILQYLPKLEGDERRLKQVVINLVKNALKFTNSGGQIVIQACYTASGFIVVNVRDNGVGIEKDNFPKLLTRFGKLQRTALMNHEGIGLGLTIVKQIAESAGGAVGFDSKGQNQGSLFSFSMKMKKIQDAQQSFIRKATTSQIVEEIGARADLHREKQSKKPAKAQGKLEKAMQMIKIESIGQEVRPLIQQEVEEVVDLEYNANVEDTVYRVQRELEELKVIKIANFIPETHSKKTISRTKPMLNQDIKPQVQINDHRSPLMDMGELLSSKKQQLIKDKITITKPFVLESEQLYSNQDHNDELPEGLIIDDNPMILEQLNQMLRNFSINCNYSINALDALEQIKNRMELLKNQDQDDNFDHHRSRIEMYQFIMVDFYMPQMDGPSFIRELKSLLDQAELPMPFICCSSSNEDASQLIELSGASVNHFLPKPLNASNLSQMVQLFFESRDRNDKNKE